MAMAPNTLLPYSRLSSVLFAVHKHRVPWPAYNSFAHVAVRHVIKGVPNMTTRTLPYTQYNLIISPSNRATFPRDEQVST